MWFLFPALFLSYSAFLTPVNAHSSDVISATIVRVGCTISVPPFVILQNDRGITLDILRSTLANAGLELELHYAPNAENITQFKANQLDALCVTSPEATPKAFFSQYPLVSFQNSAISLQNNNIQIKSIADLAKYKILSFNMASRLLPPNYGAVIKSAPYYAEVDNQLEQVKALFAGEAEVVIMEQTVFRYYLSQLRRSHPENLKMHQAYVFADIFLPTVYYPAFRTRTLRDSYDKGFKSLLDSGENQRIIDDYSKLLDNYLFNQSRLERERQGIKKPAAAGSLEH